MRMQQPFNLFYLYLDATRADHIVATTQNTEATAVKLCNIVGNQRLLTHFRSLDDQTALVRE